MKVNDKKTINAWCMYDWANSVYSLTITTAVFPTYFLAVTSQNGGIVDFFGFKMSNSVLYSYHLTIAFLLVALMNPFLSAIADYRGSKKRFMQFFCYLGAFSCAGLFFFDGSSVEFGVILSILAGIGYAGSLVFYNAYLPEIATEDQLDKVSARGYSLGYIGSVLLLILNLAMILSPSLFGIEVDAEGKAVNSLLPSQISFLTVGIWWFGFAQITFSKLEDKKKDIDDQESIFAKGIKELKKVWNESKQLPLLRKYLIAFFFFSMGVQTVMYLATIFGEEVVGMSTQQLIQLVLILQILAILGAYAMSVIASKKGNIFALKIALILWACTCIAAFFIEKGMIEMYYALGVLVGLVMGGIQSMARSTYSKLIPQGTNDTASYFSFYETLEKSSVALGTFVYGLVRYLTGSMNNSALSLVIFFIIGYLILMKIPSKQTYNTQIEKDEK
ncbi:MAG: MFS transporter [Cytophagales bacterium]|nr:MFS transporter [Cytophagales bacterium]